MKKNLKTSYILLIDSQKLGWIFQNQTQDFSVMLPFEVFIYLMTEYYHGAAGIKVLDNAVKFATKKFDQKMFNVLTHNLFY